MRTFFRHQVSACAAALAAVFVLAAIPGLPVHAVNAQTISTTDIVYDFGNGIGYSVTAPVALSMMTTAADGVTPATDAATGEYIPDPSKIRSFLLALDSMYAKNIPASSSTGVDFMTTRGDIVHVPAGTQRTFTTAFDYNTEVNYLYAALAKGLAETHVPTYTVGVGGTYVEVDITNQMLYYYENGIRKYQTPVVTGNTSIGHDTPTGAFFVRTKQTNQVLVGTDAHGAYQSPVKYWVPIYGNSVGIHDANWRSHFGGSIYRTAGSHGCINVPPSNMAALYPMLQVGTTVLVFN
jgi:lipoprotein-anchoring transpeptidase ErfK/SrfK